MLKYFKRQICKIAKGKFKSPELNNFPLYYSENEQLIREEKDGAKFAISVDKNGNETILRRIS